MSYGNVSTRQLKIERKINIAAPKTKCSLNFIEFNTSCGDVSTRQLKIERSNKHDCHTNVNDLIDVMLDINY